MLLTSSDALALAEEDSRSSSSSQLPCLLASSATGGAVGCGSELSLLKEQLPPASQLGLNRG